MLQNLYMALIISKHRKIHDPQLKCDAALDCSYRSAAKKELHKHYRTTHKKWADENNIRDTSCYCEACGQSFKRSDYRKNHLKRFSQCRAIVEKKQEDG